MSGKNVLGEADGLIQPDQREYSAIVGVQTGNQAGDTLWGALM